MSATATPAPPRLRQDLVLSRQDTPEGARFVLKDPRNGAFFRMQEAEHAIVRRLDGATPLDAVAAGVSQELGVDASAEDVAPFVEQLDRRGLLDKGAATLPQAGGGFLRGTLLYFRFAAFDPDRFLSRHVGKVGFFFTPWFVAGAALLVLWALGATVAWREEIARDITRLWRPEMLFLAWATILGVTTLHEFAHGFTCKRFGGEVREMGFMLIYFQPAFYCNVSDAYLFPQKSRRLWVTASGILFELFLWGLATLAWRVLERDTFLSAMALVVMAMTGIRAFFNLNPLIKLDGYYLLTDLVDCPNLRPRAFAYLGSRFRALWGGESTVPEPSPRERRIFLFYGLVAGVFSYWLLTQILLGLGAYLTWKYQGWGFAMIAGLTAATFVPRPTLPKWWRLALLSGTLATLLAFLPVGHAVSGEFDLLPGDNADVRAEIEGVLEELFVAEGTRVAALDPIARVSDRDLRARLAMAEAEIGEHEARLRLLRAGPRPEELEVARISVRKARDRLGHGQGELERVRKLAVQGLESEAALERAEKEVAVLGHEVEECATRLAALEAGCRPEEIVEVERRIDRTRAESARLQGDIARAVVRAPHGGTVTTPRLREKLGEYLKKGDLIAEVHETRTMTAEVAVPEREIAAVRPGMPATLRFRSVPDRTFEGTVAAIGAAARVEAEGAREARTVTVRIAVDNPDGLLRPNLTGFARIDAGDRKALDAVTGGVRRFVRLEFWSWW